MMADSDTLPRHLAPAEATREGDGGGYKSFVAAALVACFGVLGAVFTLNVLVDPLAIAGTGLVAPAVETDRGIKLDLIENLRVNPEILILGSSRARQAEPSFLRRLTGHTGFNAAVTGGTAADAWVMTRFAAERFRGQPRRFIWFVDVGIATNGVNPELEDDPRASRYLAGKSLDFTLDDVATYISPQATRASWRVLDACVFDTCRSRVRYLPDGSIAQPSLRFLPERSKSLRRAVAKLVAGTRAHPPRGGRIDPRRYVYFERAITFMNERGARPVIVLNPVHPEVLAELRKHGYPGRRAALAYLRRLQQRLDFVFVDGQDIRRWGGSPVDWSNATHVNRRNMRRLLRYVVAQSDRELR
jgi:hypothetical protein